MPPGDVVPTINIAGFIGIHSPTSYLIKKEGTSQVLDTLTYTKGRHTIKIGADIRKLSSLHTQVFSDYRMRSYQFNGSASSALLGSGAGTPLASFLLGYPDSTSIATVINPDTYAYSFHYATFAQDDWKVTPNFTFNFGLRWEYHPSFHDHNDNLANFDRTTRASKMVKQSVARSSYLQPKRTSFLTPGSCKPLLRRPFL